MGRSLLAGLVFFAVFVAGGITGGFLTARWVKQVKEKNEQPVVAPFGPQNVWNLAGKLDLTQEQREKIRQIRGQYDEELRVLHRETDNARQRMMEDIKKILTAEQQEKFRKLLDEQRGRLQEQREKVRRFLEQRWRREDRELPSPPPHAPSSQPPAGATQPAPSAVSPSNPPAPSATQPRPDTAAF